MGNKSGWYQPNISGGSSPCADATVQNSDGSWVVNIPSGGSDVAPNSDVYVNSVIEGDVVSVKDIDILFQNSDGLVTPSLVAIVGNQILTEIPDTTYDIYVNGVFNQSTTLSSAGSHTINITA